MRYIRNRENSLVRYIWKDDTDGAAEKYATCANKITVKIIEEETILPALTNTPAPVIEDSKVVMKNGRPIKIKGKDIFRQTKKTWSKGFEHDDGDGFGNHQSFKSKVKNRNKSIREQIKAMTQNRNPANFGEKNIQIQNGDVNKYVNDLQNQIMQNISNQTYIPDIEAPDIDDYVKKTNWKKEFNQIKDKVFDELAQYEYTVEDTPEAKENLMKKGQEMIKQLIEASNYSKEEKEQLTKQADNLIKKDEATGKRYFYDSDSDDDDRYSYLKRKLRKRIVDSDSDSDEERRRRKRILNSSDRRKTLKELMEKRKRNLRVRYGDSSSDDETSMKKRLNKIRREREREEEKEKYKKKLEREKELEKEKKEREKGTAGGGGRGAEEG